MLWSSATKLNRARRGLFEVAVFAKLATVYGSTDHPSSFSTSVHRSCRTDAGRTCANLGTSSVRRHSFDVQRLLPSSQSSLRFFLSIPRLRETKSVVERCHSLPLWMVVYSAGKCPDQCVCKTDNAEQWPRRTSNFVPSIMVGRTKK